MRLTDLGWGILAGGILMIVGGVVLGLPAVLAVGVVLVLLVVLAATIVAEVPQVSVEREAVPGEVERGGPAEVRLRFASTSTRRPRPLTVIESVNGEPRIATIGPIPAARRRLHLLRRADRPAAG